MSERGSEPDGVENPAVRAAIEAFAAESGKVADGGSLEVLRHCMHGHLLLDITGSDLRMSQDAASLAPGSTIRIATTSDPDGGTALVAFTSQAQIALTRSAAAQIQSMVQPGVDVLELVRSQDHQWLYLDPAGPTCALSRAEVEFALQLPHNAVVRDALSVVTQDPERRDVLIQALRADGELLVLLERSDVELGEQAQDLTARNRTSTLPDGRTALLVFTSGPETAAHGKADSIATLSNAEIRDMLQAGCYAGLVINPSGPSAAVSAEELFG